MKKVATIPTGKVFAAPGESGAVVISSARRYPPGFSKRGERHNSNLTVRHMSKTALKKATRSKKGQRTWK